MSPVNNVSAYAVERQSRAGALQPDKTRLRRLLMLVGVGVFLIFATAFYLASGRYLGSDGSFAHANELMVSTDVSGLIKTVNVHEGQQVKAGEILFTFDPLPFQIALDNAKAALAATVQDVESLRALHSQLIAQASLFNRALGLNGPSMLMNPQIPFGLANLNSLIEYRSQVQAHANDFLFMVVISLSVFAVIWLMRRPSFAAGQTPKVEVVD